MVSRIPIKYKQFAQLHGIKYSNLIQTIFKEIYLTYLNRYYPFRNE